MNCVPFYSPQHQCVSKQGTWAVFLFTVAYES
uniref:Uncharacterized protein n=1 Tax=Arundo donax TaxID=35708 RepID=A0A0A9TEE7_ARUDO